MRRLSPAQRRTLRHIVRNYGLSIYAEDDLRLHGAAFQAVLRSLDERGLIDGSNQPTELGREALQQSSGAA